MLAWLGHLRVLWLVGAFVLGALYMVVASVWGAAKKFAQPLAIRTEFSVDGVRTTFGDVVSNVNWAALTPAKSSDRYRAFAVAYGSGPVFYPADGLTAGQWAEVDAMRAAAIADSAVGEPSARLTP
jgi:hypothetical protein